jgi:hypothetical protein
MAFKNKSPFNPVQPRVSPRPPAPIKPAGGPPSPAMRPVAPSGGLPPGAAEVTGQAKGIGQLALQKPWRPRRQQLVTPGMPSPGAYPGAVRTY